MKQGEQRHHETGRAEAALRTVKVDHGLLDRMQAALMHEIFDADEVGAIGLAGQHDAGVDRGIDEATADAASQHDRAGPAIPLGTTLLRSGGAFMETKIVEKREMRCSIAQANDRAAAHELNVATHGRLAPFDIDQNPGRIPKIT